MSMNKKQSPVATAPSPAPNGEITKEAVALLRRAAEITGNTEIKFAAAFIQSEYDKKHPRGTQKKELASSASSSDIRDHASSSLKETLEAKESKESKPKASEAKQESSGRRKQMTNSRSAPNISLNKTITLRKFLAEDPKDYQAKAPRPDKYQANGKRWVPKKAQQLNAASSSSEAKSAPLSAPIVCVKEASELQSLADRTGLPELKERASELQHLADAKANDVARETQAEAPVPTRDAEPVKLHLIRPPEDLSAPGSPIC